MIRIVLSFVVIVSVVMTALIVNTAGAGHEFLLFLSGFGAFLTPPFLAGWNALEYEHGADDIGIGTYALALVALVCWATMFACMAVTKGVPGNGAALVVRATGVLMAIAAILLGFVNVRIGITKIRERRRTVP